MNLRNIETQILSGKELTSDEKAYASRKILQYWDEHPDVINRFPRWKKYLAWVAGYQNFDYNKITKKLVEVPLKRRRALSFNKLKPFVRTLLAKLSQDAPQMSVAPNTSESEDLEAARAADSLVSGLVTRMGFINELNQVKLWLITCNRAFMRVFWNTEKKGVLGYLAPDEEDDDIAKMLEEGNTSSSELEESFEDGDVDIEAISPFEIRVDPLYADREKWRWLVHGQEVDADELEREYDLKPGSLKEPSDKLENAYNIQLHDEADLVVGSSANSTDVTGRVVVKKTLWTPKMYITVGGDQVLAYGKNDMDEIPFYCFEEKLIPIDNYEKGFPYNESLLKDAIPIQREFNRTISNMSLALERASKLKIMAPLGSILNKRQWTNDFGVFVDYNNSAGEPHQMKLDPFPMDVPQYKSDLEREIESSMNIHEASFGRLPERASHASGTLVNILLEQDDVVLNPLLNQINDVLSHVWTLVLKLVQDNYTTSRMIKYIGEDMLPSVMKFKGSDLRGNTDVKVVSQVGLPRSRALRIEYIMQLREAGLLTDDKATLEMLEFGSADKIFKTSMLHERKAQRENMQIESNKNIDPREVKGWIYELEEHAIHLQKHLEVRLGARYEALTPNQKEALEVHIQGTKDALIEQMAPAEAQPPLAAHGVPDETMPEEPIAGSSPEPQPIQAAGEGAPQSA